MRFGREVAHATEVECAAQTLGRDATHSSCYFTRDSHREARDLRDTPELGRARATEALATHATRATKALATHAMDSDGDTRDGQRRRHTRWTATKALATHTMKTPHSHTRDRERSES
jgi:hypothetical protein